MIEKRVFIRLLVYNWDASPRQQIVRHFVRSGDGPSPTAKARHLAHRLEQAIRANRNFGQMKWLDQHHGVYGFIERVEGVFLQTTERVL